MRRCQRTEDEVVFAAVRRVAVSLPSLIVAGLVAAYLLFAWFGFQPLTCQENQVVRLVLSMSPGIGLPSLDACGVVPLASRKPAGSTQKQSG